jgi:hypothetical protein
MLVERESEDVGLHAAPSWYLLSPSSWVCFCWVVYHKNVEWAWENLRRWQAQCAW